MKTLAILFVGLTSISTFADYSCSVTAYKRYDVGNGRFIYPSNVAAVGSRILREQNGYIESGSISGGDFIIESKKSNISFGNYMNGWDDSQEAKFVFIRNSNPNRYKVMTQHIELGQVELKGNEMKYIDLDGGLYRVWILCSTNKLD